MLSDDKSAVRRGAANGLGASGADADSAIADLVERLARDPDCKVRASAAWALGRIVPTSVDSRVVDEAIETLTEAVFNGSRAVRLRATQALGEIGERAQTAFESLIWLRLLCEGDEEMGVAVEEALAKIARPRQMASLKS